MTLVGVDLHTREQTVAVLDTATGEREDLRLRHDGEEVERFYAGLRPPVTVAIESTGYALWFHALMPRLGHTLLVGDAAKIRASVVRKTKTDRRDARHILTLLSEKRLPTVWVPDPGDEQASYAQFTDLESALVTAGISFDRLSDPVAKYGECVRFFRPGMTEPYDAASEGYEPMLPVREVRRRFADGLDNLGAWLDPFNHHGKRKARRVGAGPAGQRPPTLPRSTIERRFSRQASPVKILASSCGGSSRFRVG